jgi:Domain of unknown function (DUF4129)
VTARRLVAAGGAVTALLVVAGIASHGRPLAGGGGTGPSATFFDYFATTLFIVAAAILALVVWALAAQPKGGAPHARSQWHIVSTLLTLAAAAVVGALILRHTDLANRLRAATSGNAGRQGGQHARPNGKEVRDPRLRWDEIAIVLALAGGTVLVVLAGRRTLRPRPWALRREETVSQALDESLDDLRADPDLRRAIVAAYARMERALAGAGLARRPAEAPFEYMERALTSLEASAEAARRLTALFECAKFSHHEPGPAMRDEAIDALVAVRDELRRPAETAVPA